jgi:Tol biopolymer transport system component
MRRRCDRIVVHPLVGMLVLIVAVGGCGQRSAGSSSGAAGSAAPAASLVAVVAGPASAPAPSDPAPSTRPSAAPSASAPLQAAPWIAFTAHNGEGIGIYLAGSDGADKHGILLDIPAGVIHRPDWSRDGRQIAVEALGDEDPPKGSIWIADASGKAAHKVAACDALPCLQLAMPAWAPDGSSVALVRFDLGRDGKAAGKTAIEILDLGSGRRRTIAETANGTTSFAYPRWAPDGRSIVVEYQAFSDARQEDVTGSAIATIDAAGTGSPAPRLVTPMSGFGAHPDWSPDGKRLVFGSYGIESFETGGPGASNLYTVNPDGSDLTQVTRFAVGDSRAGHPSWTPDGKRIIFTKIDGKDFDGYGSRRIASIAADGSDLQVIDDFLGTFPRLQPTP